MTITMVDLPTFEAFLKYKDSFRVLVAAGVFECANGKATLNFHNGHVQSVHVEQRTYQHVSGVPSAHLPI